MVDRPLSSLNPQVLNALRIGAYQIYYMDRVPERAAVSSTVDAIKNAGAPNAASFVNAILRRAARKAEYFPKPDKTTHYLEYCAMQHAHPLWMITRWFEQLNQDRFEYLLTQNNKPPKSTLKLISKNSLPDDEPDFGKYLLKNLSVKSHTRPLRGAYAVETLPKFDKCEAFKKGCYIVQQESAQLCCEILAPKANETVLDACGAPGGKSIYLWESGVAEKDLTVCDISHKRLAKITENFERVGLVGAQILRGDVVELTKDQVFDKILIDAPCSALGVVRRHPEIKWQRSLRDIEACAENQKHILHGLAGRVKEGGELLYVVCSFEPEETYLQIDEFLNTHSEYEVHPLDDRVHDFYRKYVTKRQELVIYGGNSDDLDGFYAVLLKKSWAGS